MITLTFSLELEDIAEMFEEGSQEYKWIMDALGRDDEEQIQQIMEDATKPYYEGALAKLGVGSVVVSSLNQLAKVATRQYLKEQEDAGELERDGADENAFGTIGPDHKYTVQNHSAVKVLMGGKDDYGIDHSGRTGVIEEFNFNDIPLTVAVQFPNSDGKYEGEGIREFRYFDIAPIGAEEL